MSARLILPPTELPVPLAAAITKARANGAGMDAEIALEVQGIAGEVEHELQRALVEQTWAVTMTAFPPFIPLHMAAPLIAIDHVQFYDVDGELQTLDPQDYVVPKGSGRARVIPAPGHRWPDTAVRADAVDVQYRCGFGVDHTAVPAPIQSYILGRIEAIYSTESRTARFLDGLLDRFKVYG